MKEARTTPVMKFLLASAILFVILYLNMVVLGIDSSTPCQWVGLVVFGLSAGIVLNFLARRPAIQPKLRHIKKSHVRP
jgi:hypothetical protein